MEKIIREIKGRTDIYRIVEINGNLFVRLCQREGQSRLIQRISKAELAKWIENDRSRKRGICREKVRV